MAPKGFFSIEIPGVALEWAIKESQELMRANSWKSFDQIVAICMIYGVYVGATNEVLRNVIAGAKP